MEKPGPTRSSRHPEIFLGIFPPPSKNPPEYSLELSEHDIFNTPTSTPTTTTTNPNPNNRSTQTGIFAALKSSSTSPIFNHKATPSSSSTSPISITTIPKRPAQIDRWNGCFHPQSAPVNIPINLSSKRRSIETDVLVNEEEDVFDDEEDNVGVIRPPHEVVAARGTPLLACSVLEGAGRTLKGRDLRQVRNAIWRQTGFID